MANPHSAFARGYLGASRASGGDYDGAVANCEEAIRLSPRDPLVVILSLCQGRAALLTERYDEAIDFTTQAALPIPSSPTSTPSMPRPKAIWATLPLPARRSTSCCAYPP
ncbi:MAG TPA: tetratricopeptide repeat protein [Candidatus Nitrosotalea sp.]|nr:tetratricopeptide repeat protein [Candidatus Nitrosotalea sp.]